VNDGLGGGGGVADAPGHPAREQEHPGAANGDQRHPEPADEGKLPPWRPVHHRHRHRDTGRPVEARRAREGDVDVGGVDGRLGRRSHEKV